MKYIKPYTVRWHDTGADRTMTPSRVLEILQETATHHCRSVDHDLDALRDREGLGFVVVRLSIELMSPIYAMDDITVETFVTESRGLSFPRSYVIRRNGEILAKAVSTWALLRLDNRSFVRVSDIDFGFEPEAPLMLSDNVPLRLRISDGIAFETVGQREIYYSDVDYNLHMNNTKYPDVLANYLPDREHRRITSVVLSYLREARLGDTLSVLRATEDGETFRFRLQASDGSTVMDAQIGTKYQD